MTVSQATARQPSLITPLNSLLSVLDLTGEIIDFTLTNTDLNNQHGKKWVFSKKKNRWTTIKQVFHHVRPGVSHLTNDNYCVNAAPCRLLAQGKESVKYEKLCQPHRTGPDHKKNRKTVNLDRYHQTGPVSGGIENVCQTTKCPKCGTQSACRIETNPFWELRKPWGLDPR